MRLNVGCGDDYRDGYLNIDLRPTADLMCDIRHLPYPDGSATEVLALDVLEHLQDYRVALEEWHRVLIPGGLLTLRVPNLHAIGHQLTYWGSRPGPQLDALVKNLYGGHLYGPEGAWDTHHTGFTPESMSVLLTDTGFTVTGNDLLLNMTVEAVRNDDRR